jgi:hypothetical protein
MSKLTLPLPRIGIVGVDDATRTVVRVCDTARLEAAYAALMKRCEAAEAVIEVKDHSLDAGRTQRWRAAKREFEEVVK